MIIIIDNITDDFYYQIIIADYYYYHSCSADEREVSAASDILCASTWTARHYWLYSATQTSACSRLQPRSTSFDIFQATRILVIICFLIQSILALDLGEQIVKKLYWWEVWSCRNVFCLYLSRSNRSHPPPTKLSTAKDIL